MVGFRGRWMHKIHVHPTLSLSPIIGVIDQFLSKIIVNHVFIVMIIWHKVYMMRCRVRACKMRGTQMWFMSPWEYSLQHALTALAQAYGHSRNHRVCLYIYSISKGCSCLMIHSRYYWHNLKLNFKFLPWSQMTMIVIMMVCTVLTQQNQTWIHFDVRTPTLSTTNSLRYHEYFHII